MSGLCGVWCARRATSPRGVVMECVLMLGLVSIASGCSLHDAEAPGALVPATVDEDASLPALEVRDTRLHVRQVGPEAGQVIVMLHGGPGADFRYMTRLEPLADTYRLVFFDQRGAGLSRRHEPGTITTAEMVADLDALITKVSPARRVILFGHSWGGMLAAAYLNEHPERVAAAVLVDPGPFTGARLAELEITSLGLFDRPLSETFWLEEALSVNGHARADYMMRVALHGATPKYHYDEADPMPVSRMGLHAWRDTTEAATGPDGLPEFDFTTRLDAFTSPVLFVRGGLNEVHTDAFLRAQLADFPNGVMRTIESAGHDQVWTHADEVIAHSRAFLDEHGL